MTRVVGFAEDPGAANFLVGLGQALGGEGSAFDLYASGAATAYFAARGERARPVPVGWHGVLAGARVAVVGTGLNPGSPSLRLLDAARAAGVPSFAVVDAPTQVPRRMRDRTGDPLGHRPDFIVAAHAEVISQCSAIGFPAAQVRLIRHPHYDRLESRRNALEGMDAKRKRRQLFGTGAERTVVVLVCEPSYRAGGLRFTKSASYTLPGRPGAFRRTDVVAGEVFDALGRLGLPVHTVLRLHSKDDPAGYRTWAGEAGQFSAAEDPLEVVFFADAVVGLTGNLMTEAAILGKPVLAVVPDPAECEWIPEATAPTIPIVWTREALDHALAALLRGPRPAYRRVDVARSSLAEVVLAAALEPRAARATAEVRP